MFQNDGILNKMHTGKKSAGVLCCIMMTIRKKCTPVKNGGRFVFLNDDCLNKMDTGTNWRALCVSN